MKKNSLLLKLSGVLAAVIILFGVVYLWQKFGEKIDEGPSPQELSYKIFILEERLKAYEKLEGLLAGRPKPAKLAPILSRTPQLPYDSLLVSGGAEEIKQGDLALAYGAVLIGQVAEVFRAEAKVKLFSYPGEKIEGFLENSAVNVLLEGIGGLNLKFALPKNAEVKIGQRVFVNFSAPYLLGQVEQIRVRPAEPLMEVLVKIPLNLWELSYLEIYSP